MATKKNSSLTPQVVKIFVLLSLIISLIAGVTDHISPHLFGKYTLSWFFTLHPMGIREGFFWQILTHPFIHPTAHGMDFFYLISLTFSSYLLWKIGTLIAVQKGVKHFLILFLGSTLVSSFIAILVFFISRCPGILAGGTPLVYSLLLAMIFLMPEIDLLLFLAIPIKAKWFILGSMGAFLLVDLSHGNFVHFFSILGSLIFSYFYCLLFWRNFSPFTTLHPVEKLFIERIKTSSETLYRYVQNPKIYDIKTGKILLTDEAFIDACLAKIADKGKDSLSWKEKIRLRKLSKKKRKGSINHFA